MYFFGKDPFISFFNVEKGILEKASYDQVSEFQGGLILPSVLYIKQHMSVLITGNSVVCKLFSGGAAYDDGRPEGSVFIAEARCPGNFTKMAPMSHARFAHSSVYMQGIVYVFGGIKDCSFSSFGDFDALPTDSCEALDLGMSSWSISAPMV